MLMIAVIAQGIFLLFFDWIVYPPIGAKVENVKMLSILGETSNNTNLSMRPVVYGISVKIKY